MSHGHKPIRDRKGELIHIGDTVTTTADERDGFKGEVTDILETKEDAKRHSEGGRLPQVFIRDENTAETIAQNRRDVIHTENQGQ
ncbi:hypothetical protein FRC17_007682 [Serendipita sp. 399]|nr:hypothetical protein FRC17_007682 [Serendipita sp. 399]